MNDDHPGWWPATYKLASIASASIVTIGWMWLSGGALLKTILIAANLANIAQATHAWVRYPDFHVPVMPWVHKLTIGAASIALVLSVIRMFIGDTLMDRRSGFMVAAGEAIFIVAALLNHKWPKRKRGQEIGAVHWSLK